MKPGSQSARIVHVLRNAHGWMTTQEILAGAGYCSFSARISELRAAGYDIRCRKIEGMPPGTDAQEYLLVSEPLVKPDNGSAGQVASSRDPGHSEATEAVPGFTSGPSTTTALPGTATAVPTELRLFDLGKGAYANHG